MVTKGGVGVWSYTAAIPLYLAFGVPWVWFRDAVGWKVTVLG